MRFDFYVIRNGVVVFTGKHQHKGLVKDEYAFRLQIARMIEAWQRSAVPSTVLVVSKAPLFVDTWFGTDPDFYPLSEVFFENKPKGVPEVAWQGILRFRKAQVEQKRRDEERAVLERESARAFLENQGMRFPLTPDSDPSFPVCWFCGERYFWEDTCNCGYGDEYAPPASEYPQPDYEYQDSGHFTHCIHCGTRYWSEDWCPKCDPCSWELPGARNIQCIRCFTWYPEDEFRCPKCELEGQEWGGDY